MALSSSCIQVSHARLPLSASKPNILQVVVGWAAIVAPVLHCITDAMEWHQGGFSPVQLRLNYLAFLPMPWLLLGIYALLAQTPNYEVLWEQLGPAYTAHGAAMVFGDLLFGSPNRAV